MTKGNKDVNPTSTKDATAEQRRNEPVSFKNKKRIADDNLTTEDTYEDIPVDQADERPPEEGDHETNNPASGQVSREATDDTATRSYKRFLWPFSEGEQRHLVCVEDNIEDDITVLITKSENFFRGIWRDAFGLLRLMLSPILIFILELVRFLAHDLFYLFVMRIVQILGDFVIKPLLTTVYNSILLPLYVFIWNISDISRKSTKPLFVIFDVLTDHVTKMLKAFRLVEITRTSSSLGKSRIEDI